MVECLTAEEFYFSVPYDQMDLCLYGMDHGVEVSEVARVLDLTMKQVQRIYQDIESKRRTTRYLHLPPLLID